MELHDAPPARPAVHGLAAVAVDCADPPALAEFYAGLLGAPWAADEDGDASVYGYGGPNIDFLTVPEGKSGKNRVHLDLRATDLLAAVDHGDGATFRRLVGRPVGRVRPQPVPKEPVPRGLGTVRTPDVQVDARLVEPQAAVLVPAGLAHDVPVADPDERWHVHTFVAGISDGQIDVDDGLGRQPGHRCRACVVERDGGRAQGRP